MHVSIIAGGDRLSRLRHYHGPRVLIGRVRDGNGSRHPGLATGSLGPPRGGGSYNGWSGGEVARTVRPGRLGRPGVRGRGRRGQAVGC